MSAVERAALEKEREREAALAVNDGHAEGVRTLTFGGAEDETDGPGNVMINVVVDMTDEGKRVAHPTPDNPAYYVALPMGNKEFGYAAFFQKPPPKPAEVKALLDRELSKQGYLAATRQHDPSLVLAFYWGYIDQTDGAIPSLGFVASMLRGNPYATNYNKSYTDRKMEGHSESYREIWYILVSAFDANDWVHHKRTLLWCAHIYTPSWGHHMDEVLPALIATAGPILGRETSRPQMITSMVGSDGRVIVGTPEVKNFSDPFTAPTIGK